MSGEEIQEIQEIPEDIPVIHEDNPVVPTRGRGRPKGAKNKVKILVVDTAIPAVTLSEPTENEEAAVTMAEEPTKKEAAPIPKKPRASRTKRAQPAVTMAEEPTKKEEAAVTIAEEPTKKEEAAPIPKKPRATRTKRAQPAVTLPSEPIDPLPERRVSDHVSPIASMMISLHEMRQERMAARKAMYRNMIA